MALALSKAWREYAPGRGFPLGAYAGFLGVWTAGLGALFFANRGRRLRLQPRDLLLLAPATHKLARIAARDWVTSPLRAPFVRYQSPASGGEVNEAPRGEGLRSALGSLVSCPFCMGPWAGLALFGLWTLRPKEGRLVAALFTAVTASDFLHRLYALLSSARGRVETQKARAQLSLDSERAEARA